MTSLSLRSNRYNRLKANFIQFSEVDVSMSSPWRNTPD